MSETQTVASTTETSNDNLVPPGAEAHEHVEETGDPTFEIAKLGGFLEENFPEEMRLSNLQVPESAVDVAIRLLLALSSTAPLSAVQRCDQEYCNRPAGHSGDCGWVHNG